jgi:hypothetical protein
MDHQKDLSCWQTNTMEEFEAALTLCNNAAPGEDGIRFGMLRELPLEGNKFLLHISNDILSNGNVPGSWQRTKIIPILKPGKDSSNCDTYRAISMLHFVRKMFEKMILTIIGVLGLPQKSSGTVWYLEKTTISYV